MTKAQHRRRSLADMLRLAAVACMLAFPTSAFAEEASPQLPERQAGQKATQDRSAAAAQPRAFEPGLLDALGRWFSNSAANVNAGLKGTQETLTDLGGRAGDAAKGAASAATGAAKDAAEAAVGAAGDVAKFSATRVVTGRERCERAANGAPDCLTAANNVCRTNGFTTGRSLDIQSAQKCPARLWLSGRLPADGECAVETFVTRAACQ